MIHVFVLTVMLKGVIVSNDMYFAIINVCQEYAHAIVHGKHTNVHHNNMVGAYCIPTKVDPSTITLYVK